MKKNCIIQLEDGRKYMAVVDNMTEFMFGGEIVIRGRIIRDVFSYSNDLISKNAQIAVPKEVIFNDPATIVIWSDGTKTVVKCSENDTYNKEVGLAMCVAKKYFGNKGNYNDVFHKFINK